jgi:hypothetical protein
MSQNSEQYTKDFLKGQELPTTNAHGYLQGNLPLAGKYNPSGVKKFLPIMYLYAPAAILSVAILILAAPIWQKIIFGLVFVGSVYMIYKTVNEKDNSNFTH